MHFPSVLNREHPRKYLFPAHAVLSISWSPCVPVIPPATKWTGITKVGLGHEPWPMRESSSAVTSELQKTRPCREGSPDAGADRPPTGEWKGQKRAKRSRSGRARWMIIIFFSRRHPACVRRREGVEQTRHVLVLMLVCLCVVGCISVNPEFQENKREKSMCLPDKSPEEVVSPPAFLGLRSGGVVAVASCCSRGGDYACGHGCGAVARSRSSVVCCSASRAAAAPCRVPR